MSIQEQVILVVQLPRPMAERINKAWAEFTALIEESDPLYLRLANLLLGDPPSEERKEHECTHP